MATLPHIENGEFSAEMEGPVSVHLSCSSLRFTFRAPCSFPLPWQG